MQLLAQAGEIDGSGRTEELLDETGANVSHLRCGYFFTNLSTRLDEIRAGTLSTPWPLDHSMAWVDPRDVRNRRYVSGLSSGFVAEDPRTVLTTTPTTLASWASVNLR